MKQHPQNYQFSISVTTDSKTGETLSVYFKIRKGKVAETREFGEGTAFADYGRNGELLGIELLAPCNLKVLDQIAKDAPSRQFIRRAVPRKMVLAGT